MIELKATQNAMQAESKACVRTPWKKKLNKVTRNWVLYLFLLPTLIYLLIFNYWPMYGVQIAFRNFKPTKGIWGSPWVGMKNFDKFFHSYMFKDLLTNTIVLSVYQIVASFAFPILLALLLNYCVSNKLRKVTQMVTYAPHFISTVVLVGMLNVFLSESGIINHLLNLLGLRSVPFLSDAGMFRHIYVWSHIWQRTGYNSVIYIAALAGVNPELHEAAIVDGANKLQRIFHVTLPGLVPVITIQFIMWVGFTMTLGYEKNLLLYNPAIYETADVIGTYMYRYCLMNTKYGLGAAVGVFNTVVNIILLFSVNALFKRFSENSLW